MLSAALRLLPEPSPRRPPPLSRPIPPVGGLAGLLRRQQAIGTLPVQDLCDLVRNAQLRTVRSRVPIFRQGDNAHAVIALIEGSVKLACLAASGHEAVLDVVSDGLSFGELAVVNGRSRECDAIALQPSRIVAIDGRDFLRVMERSPDGRRMLMDLIGQRLGSATQRILDTVALPAPARLAKALLYLAGQRCGALRDGARFHLPLSQTELGGMTGLTRESVNKHLSALRAEGWIAVSGRHVTLMDVTALEDLLGEPAQAD